MNQPETYVSTELAPHNLIVAPRGEYISLCCPKCKGFHIRITYFSFFLKQVEQKEDGSYTDLWMDESEEKTVNSICCHTCKKTFQIVTKDDYDGYQSEPGVKVC